MQFASVRCSMAQEVADDLFEDQLDVVACAARLRQIFGVESLAQVIEGLSEGWQRPKEPESNRIRVDGASSGEAGLGLAEHRGNRGRGVGLHGNDFAQRGRDEYFIHERLWTVQH